MLSCESHVDVGRPVERADAGRRNPGFVTLAALEIALEKIDRLRLPAEHHRHHPGRVELDDHVGAFVGHPHVVVLVHADGVRKGRGVVVLAPLLHELQVLIELEQLRRGRAAGRTRVAATRKDEEVALGVLGHANGFADGVARDDQAENVLGDLQLRRRFFERRLFREGGLLFRLGPPRWARAPALSSNATETIIKGFTAPPLPTPVGAGSIARSAAGAPWRAWLSPRGSLASAQLNRRRGEVVE